MHPGLSQARRPGRCHPAVQAQGRTRKCHGVFASPGCPMSAPTTYRQPVSRLWWLKKRTYFLFVMRELSSIFVAWFSVFLMIMVFSIGRGEASYQKFLNWAASPVVIDQHRGTGIPRAAHGDVVRAHPPSDGGSRPWPGPASVGHEGGPDRWAISAGGDGGPC